MPGALDDALVRPGRFDRKVFLAYPEPEDRKAILDHYLAKFVLYVKGGPIF
jgi:ATP-dependent 26S proteasome regulatory subunit